MSAVTSIVAGFVAAAGAVALYRYAERRARSLRTALRKATGASGADAREVIDFERDPATGVFRAK